MNQEKLVKYMTEYVKEKIKKDDLEASILEARQTYSRVNAEFFELGNENKELQDKLNRYGLDSLESKMVGKTKKIAIYDIIISFVILVLTYGISIPAFLITCGITSGCQFIIGDLLTNVRNFEDLEKRTVKELKQNRKEMDSRLDTLLFLRDYITRKESELRKVNSKIGKVENVVDIELQNVFEEQRSLTK